MAPAKTPTNPNDAATALGTSNIFANVDPKVAPITNNGVILLLHNLLLNIMLLKPTLLEMQNTVLLYQMLLLIILNLNCYILISNN